MCGGDLIEIYDLRESLQDRHLLQWLWRFIAPALLGQVGGQQVRHQPPLRAGSVLLPCVFGPGLSLLHTGRVLKRRTRTSPWRFAARWIFIVERCQLAPGSEVLEVGPGWGSFAQYAARQGIKVTGVTISEQSLKFMNDLAAKEKLPITTIMSDVLEFKSDKQFDAVVLLGIMEHLPNYPAILRCFDRLLKPAGHVFLDASAITKKYKLSSFITEHIYPGNHSFFRVARFFSRPWPPPRLISRACGTTGTAITAPLSIGRSVSIPTGSSSSRSLVKRTIGAFACTCGGRLIASCATPCSATAWCCKNTRPEPAIKKRGRPVRVRPRLTAVRGLVELPDRPHVVKPAVEAVGRGLGVFRPHYPFPGVGGGILVKTGSEPPPRW